MELSTEEYRNSPKRERVKYDKRDYDQPQSAIDEDPRIPS
jgi:hypothetical protein